MGSTSEEMCQSGYGLDDSAGDSLTPLCDRNGTRVHCLQVLKTTSSAWFGVWLLNFKAQVRVDVFE